MGVSISKYSELSNNDLIERFCSNEVLCPNDPFWNQLLAFNITPPSSVEDQLYFDSSTETLLQKFLTNNTQTGNLGALVQVFITRATELLTSPSLDNAMLSWQTFNALFVIRAVVKYLVEMVPEYQLALHLDVQVDRRRLNLESNHSSIPPSPPPTPATPENHQTLDQTDGAKTPDVQFKSGDDQTKSADDQTKSADDQAKSADDQTKSADVQTKSADVQIKTPDVPKTINNESRLEMLCDALIGLICDVPVTDNTYYLHAECINTLLVIMSVYMFANIHGQARLIETSFIYRTLFQGRYGMHAPLLVKTLVHNFSTMHTAPLNMFGYSVQGGSIVINIASGLWNMLTFNSSSNKRQSILTHPPVDKDELMTRLLKEHPVANQSCLLLLCLCSHWMNQDNLYRRALFSAVDIKEVSTTPSKESSSGSSLQITPPRIDMAAVHRAICATASCEHTTLLLYLMIHSCAAYKKHVLADTQIENIIIPILQCLYKAPDTNSHHMYMSLIVLLIFTEDDAFIKTIHQITIKNPLWYTERAISEITLGGLCILVIIRALQYNIVRVRDKYLHTNCLAALANMSCEFRNLHPYVAQRLISLFEILSKRRSRLCGDAQGADGDVNGVDLIHHADEKAEELWEHVCVLDEVLRMLLEILNSCLWSQLQNNLNLVYALLHKKAVFQLCKSQSRHAPILNNIDMVIGYFSSRLQRVQEGGGGELGVTEVLQVIKKGAEQWTNDRLKKLPELKFRYVEEDRPEEFFTPYAWGLVSAHGTIHWASECGARAVRELVNC